MKYVVALLLGLLFGAALFAVGLLLNPLIAETRLSPLSVTDAETISLSYSVVPAESILFTNDGESLQSPYPPKTPQLWEAPIRETSAMVAVINDARGAPAGIGVKLSSRSESTALLEGNAIVNSVWYIYLPAHGSLFIGQNENYWGFLREVYFPAWRGKANTWRGTWMSDMTSGPGVLGTAAVHANSGRLRGLNMEAVESLSVRAFSSDRGFVSADGRLTIALPETAVEPIAD